MKRKIAGRLYAAFVNEGITRESLWKDLTRQIFLGSALFIEGLKKSFDDNVKEIPRSQRFAGRPGLHEILTDEAQRSKLVRNNAIVRASAFGYTLKEIADCLGMHYATISRILKNTRNNE